MISAQLQSNASGSSTLKIRPTKLRLSKPPSRKSTKKSRRIQALRNVSLAPSSPWPKTRLTGKKAEGLTYQRKVSKFLRRELELVVKWHAEILAQQDSGFPRLYDGQWLYFEDANGDGYAQPDLFIHTGERIVVFECKLTRADAFKQIGLLYWPLLWKLFRVPLCGVEVFLNSGPGYDPHPDGPEDFADTLSLSDWTLAEWHLLL